MTVSPTTELKPVSPIKPGSSRSPSRMTLDDYLSLPDDEGGLCEFANGKVVRWMPTELHQRLLQFLNRLLDYFVSENDLGSVYVAPYKVRLSAKLGREPDLLFVSHAIASRLTRQYLDGAPTLAVEIVSPDSRTRDRRDKLSEYATAGVLEYWLIDPDTERASFYRLDDDGVFVEIAPSPTGRFSSVVLPGFWLEVGWLWSRPTPKLSTVLAQWNSE